MDPVDFKAFMADPQVDEIIKKNQAKVIIGPGSANGLVAGSEKISGLDPDKYYMVEKELDADGVAVPGYPMYVTDYTGIGPGGLWDELGLITRISGGTINDLTNFHTYTVKAAAPIITASLPYTDDTTNVLTPVDNGIITINSMDGDGYLNLSSVLTGPYEVIAVSVDNSPNSWLWTSKTLASWVSFALEGTGTEIDYVFVKDDFSEFKVLRVIISPDDTVIDIAAIQGVNVPATGGTPATTITTTEQYTGTVTWAPAVVGTFAAGTSYTATITLTPETGYTLTGVEANFFSVNGATAATNAANSGVITAVFPATAAALTVDAIPAQTYTGSAITPAVTVMGGSTTLTLATDYTVTYGNNTNVGTATVTINGIGSYAGSTGSATFVINPKVTTLTADAIPAQTYTGSAITPTVTVMDGSTTLTLATDYTVTYGNNTNAGNATVTINGAGNYAGSTGNTTFTINPKVTTLTVGAIPAQMYTGSAITPAVTVTDGLTTLTITTDYTVTYGNNTNVGNATVTITGAGNYAGSTGSATFVISATPVYDIALSGGGADPLASYTFPAATVNYGTQTALTVTVTNTGNQETGALTAALGGTNLGDFTLSITNIANIAISGTNTFTVVPKTGLAVGAHNATVTVSGAANAISQTFNVSFTVNAASSCTVSVTFNIDADKLTPSSSGTTIAIGTLNGASTADLTVNVTGGTASDYSWYYNNDTPLGTASTLSLNNNTPAASYLVIGTHVFTVVVVVGGVPYSASFTLTVTR